MALSNATLRSSSIRSSTATISSGLLRKQKKRYKKSWVMITFTSSMQTPKYESSSTRSIVTRPPSRMQRSSARVRSRVTCRTSAASRRTKRLMLALRRSSDGIAWWRPQLSNLQAP